MRLNFKRTAVAGALSLALFAGATLSATAAPGDPLNPQPVGSAAEGSKGGFFLYDGNVELITDPAKVFTRSEDVFASASSTDVNAELNPAATRPVTGAATFTGVYRFLSKKDSASVNGGTNTWNAYAVDAAAGPNGGTLTPYVGLDSINGGPGGIADDIAAGGSYWYGIAYTINNGVTVVGAVYREINIEAGTGNYTVAPMVLEVPKVASTTTLTASASSVAAGDNVTLTATVTPTEATGNVTFKNGAETIGTAASASGVATLTTATLPAGTNVITAEYAGDATHDASTSGAVTVNVTGTTAPDEATLVEGNKGSVTVTVEGTIATVTVDAAHNGKRVNVYAYSTPTYLGQHTVNGGSVTVNTASLAEGTHKLAVVDATTGDVLGWNTFEITNVAQTANRDLNAEVITSVDGEFSLVAPANTTPAVIGTPVLDAEGRSVSTGTLGAFSVIDDRTISKKGWNLTVDVADFVMGTETIAKKHLGIKPVAGTNGGPGVPVLAAAQVADSAVYAAPFADLAAGTYSTKADFDADLTFRAPLGATEGTYTSTLTLTLVSK